MPAEHDPQSGKAFARRHTRDGSDEPPSPGRNGARDFHGATRKNDTHVSTSDPDAKLFKKGAGQEAKLCFMGRALMENRNGLVVRARLTEASGTAEREAAIHMIDQRGSGSSRRLTLAANKGYDAKAFAAELRGMGVTPHIARHDAVTKTGKRRRSSVDGRTPPFCAPLFRQRRCRSIARRVIAAHRWRNSRAPRRRELWKSPRVVTPLR